MLKPISIKFLEQTDRHTDTHTGAPVEVLKKKPLQNNAKEFYQYQYYILNNLDVLFQNANLKKTSSE